MKYILAACILLASVGLYSCDDDFGSSFSVSDGESTIKINDETGRLKIESRGEVTFTDDETGIKNISDDGFVKFRKNDLSFTAKQSGPEVVYTINGGGSKNDLTDDEKKILTKAIKAMINAGFDGKHREQRLYNNGGTAAVLKAVDDLSSDWVKSMYLEYLITNDAIQSADMTSVVNRIGEGVNSDYEKSKLLQKIPASYFDNEETVSAYIATVNTIESDYEKDNCLKLIVDQPLTPLQYNAALTATEKINSDYDKANVLKQLISHGVPSESNTANFLHVTQNLGSDYEKGNVLKALLDKGVPTGSGYAAFLEVTDGLGGDYDKGEVMKKMAETRPPSEDQWIALIQASEKIGGDNDRSNVLIEIAKYMPKSDRVKGAYLITAKTITSDYDYSQAIKAVN